jgi:pyridoxine 5-phosphate synthase
MEFNSLMASLCVNIDHIATVRQARRGQEPDPVAAVALVEMAGSSGVTVHLREDQRHIQERDVRLIRQVVHGHLNLEMAATPAMVAKALEIKPDLATLVPERRQEVTTEGGLDVSRHLAEVREATARLQEAGIIVSLFIDPETEQINAAHRCGARQVEFHTGQYSLAGFGAAAGKELRKLYLATEHAQRQGLVVNAGHGLDYHNVQPVAAIPGMRELNIGHSIISRAIFDGLKAAVAEMALLIDRATRSPQAYRPEDHAV